MTCRVCGKISSGFAFRQSDGDYFYYCSEHRDQGVAVPPPLPEPEKVQASLELGAAPFGQAAFEAFLNSGHYDWQTRFVGFIRYQPEGAIGTGEDWSDDAQRWIGPPTSPNAIGAAVREATTKGLLEPTGRYVAPRGWRSHKSKKPEWRRIREK